MAKKSLLYSVVAAIAMSAAFPEVAPGAPFSAVVVYGDSLSDNGNLFALSGQPGAPYYQGRRSDGPVTVEQFAAALQTPLVDLAWIGATTGIGNYADGGTTTAPGAFSLPGMLTEFASSQAQIAPYLGSGLFVVWGGPDDFLAPSASDTTPQAIISRAVTDEVKIVTGLRSMGAQHILVLGMPDLGLTPYFQSLGASAATEGSQATDAFNAALRASLPAGTTFFETAPLLRAVVANPNLYGFTNVTDACYDGVTVCANPSQYLFFDDFHPTTSADRLLAEQLLATVVPEPSTFVLFTAAGFAFAVCGWDRNRRRI